MALPLVARGGRELCISLAYGRTTKVTVAIYWARSLPSHALGLLGAASLGQEISDLYHSPRVPSAVRAKPLFNFSLSFWRGCRIKRCFNICGLGCGPFLNFLAELVVQFRRNDRQHLFDRERALHRGVVEVIFPDRK